jgi:AraC-like DNA-binding protein
MNAKDRYNRVVDEIENAIAKGECLRPGDIAEAVSRTASQSLRDLTSVFSFMTDQPLIQYIRTRQMMAAYQSLLDSKTLDIDRAITFTGLGDQSAFNKAFRKCFGVTPGQAFKEKSDKLYEPAMTWDVISDAEARAERTKEAEPMKGKTLFGVETGAFEKITQAMDYQAMYGFTQAQANAAFELAEKTQYPLKNCFEFVDNFCIHYFSDDDGNVVIEDEEVFRDKVLKSYALAEFCIMYDLSIEEGYELMIDFATVGLSARNVDPDIIQLYLEGGMDIRRFWYAYNWGAEQGLNFFQMQEFLDNVGEVSNLDEEVLNEALYFATDFYKDVEECANQGMDEDEDKQMTGYELEMQETDFSSYERFDKEYDIDNMDY